MQRRPKETVSKYHRYNNPNMAFTNVGSNNQLVDKEATFINIGAKLLHITCFYCEQKGHYSHSCPIKAKDKQDKATKNNKAKTGRKPQS